MRQKPQHGLPNLDELDLMIIRELEQDARVKYPDLALKLNSSHSTIHRRVNRLIDQGIITLAAIPAFAALGYKTVLILAINAPPGMVNTLSKKLASANSIKSLWITAGHYDIVAVAFYRSPVHYVKLFPEEIGDIPDNVKIETMLPSQLIKSAWPHLIHHSLVTEDPHPRLSPTELDFSVIKELEKSPRASAKKIAKDIDASPSSVRSSLNKLISNKIVKIGCIPDPTALGHTAWGITFIRANPSRLNTLAEDLKVCPFITQMSLVLGTFNCVIWTTFQTSDQMHDFLDQDLGNMPGVIQFENLIALRMQKRSFNLFSGDQNGTNVPK